jgi:hypothetical protein
LNLKTKKIMKKLSQKLSVHKSIIANLKENNKMIKNLTTSWLCHLSKN